MAFAAAVRGVCQSSLRKVYDNHNRLINGTFNQAGKTQAGWITKYPSLLGQTMSRNATPMTIAMTEDEDSGLHPMLISAMGLNDTLVFTLLEIGRAHV